MILFELGAIRHELSVLLGIKLDVFTPNALPDSFGAEVIAVAKVI